MAFRKIKGSFKNRDISTHVIEDTYLAHDTTTGQLRIGDGTTPGGTIVTSDAFLTVVGDDSTEMTLNIASDRLFIAGGTNLTTSTSSNAQITLAVDDSPTFTNVQVDGNLTVSGTTTSVNTTNLEIQDALLELNKNNSGGADIDAGLLIQRGSAGNNAAFYWNEGDDVFKAVTTTSSATASSVTDTALAKIQVAEPTSSSDAATKNYVDNNSGGGELNVVGDDSTDMEVTLGTDRLFIAGGDNITTSTSSNSQLTISTSSAPAFTTASITNTTTDDSLLLTTTEDSNTAAPVITFKRNSSSPADSDYLGQLKFKGENDADQEIVYAKITAKIQDASDGTEDGLIEFANKKAGSNVITARLKSDKFQLLNGTTLEADEITIGTLDVREIVSTDSTNITVNEGLEVLGTIQVNEIVASDSTEVTINNIRTQVLTANDSTEILINDALRVSGLITGTATAAQYADLAEKYENDQTYPVGTVMMVGGKKQTTAWTLGNVCIGVISDKPAFIMNESAMGQPHAIRGKVPVRCIGPVQKGEKIFADNEGVASSHGLEFIGVSLETNTDTKEKLVECILKI